jgi:hypothetical protein
MPKKLFTDEEFCERSAKYTFAKPFTKESLLYRELFEAEYPGQAHHGQDFGLPKPGMGRLQRQRPVRPRVVQLWRKRSVTPEKLPSDAAEIRSFRSAFGRPSRIRTLGRPAVFVLACVMRGANRVDGFVYRPVRA